MSQQPEGQSPAGYSQDALPNAWAILNDYLKTIVTLGGSVLALVGAFASQVLQAADATSGEHCEKMWTPLVLLLQKFSADIRSISEPFERLGIGPSENTLEEIRDRTQSSLLHQKWPLCSLINRLQQSETRIVSEP